MEYRRKDGKSVTVPNADILVFDGDLVQRLADLHRRRPRLRPMITLTDIAYVRSGVADLDAATRFATEIVGLELADAHRSGRRPPARRPPAPLPGPGRGPVRGDRLRLHRGRLGRARGRRDRARALRAEPSIAARPPRPGPGVSASSSPSTTRSATGSSWSASRRRWPGRWPSAAPPGSPSSATCAWTRPTCTRPTGSGARASTPGCPTGSATPPASCASIPCTTSSPSSAATNRACAT